MEVGMREDTQNGTDIIVVPEQHLEDVVRRSYRYPLARGEGQVRVQDHVWPIVDVASWGLGLAVTDPEGIEPGAVLRGIVELEDRCFEVEMEVVHLSADVGEALRCGVIVRTEASAEYAAFVQDFLTRRRATLVEQEESDGRTA
jgi:hypothetical protein